MKKFIKNLKGKKVLSFVLAAIMLATTFNIALPELKLDASAAVTLGGITQTRVVGTDGTYAATYAEYAKRFFGGDGKSEPTNFVIPGLSSANDYTPQGMTYWKAKDWILISAYDASGAGKHSVIYALDGKSTEFVALFKVVNADGSVNTSHGGGIAASEYNFYYADTGSKISYVPLSEMDVAEGTVKEINLRGSIDCSKEMNSAYTSYCCYDEGVLWTGNFYFDSTSYDYAQPANDSYNSMLFGYKLQGNSSEEEWFHLQNKNLLNATSTGDFSLAKAPYGELSYNVSINKNRYIDITGNITHDESQGTCGEYAPSFATVYLTHGTTYKLEFDLTTPTMDGITDFYFLRDGGTGSYANVRYTLGGSTKVIDNGNGTYHYETTLTPGEPLVDANGSRHMDGNWDKIDDASGNYSLRFDQDNISTDKAVSITNIHIYKVPDGLEETEEFGKGCEGNPTYCVAFDDSIDKIQYAMVDNGRIYISRSWSRTDSGNHVRQLVVGEIDLNSPGTVTLNINGVERYCQYVDNTKMTTFGGSYKENTDAEKKQMLYMGEALCVMEGYLYMFGESAAWTYNGKGDKCPEPIDVIWKIDQYAIMGELRETDNEKLSYYEPVTSISDIKNTVNPFDNTDEYIIVYESSQKDPVTQKNILYALDAFGGHDENKLPKNSDGSLSENSNGYTVGIVGHPITEYNIEDGNLYLTNPEKDDLENIRWKFQGDEGSGAYKLQSVSPYYASYKDLFFNGKQSFMSKDASGVKLVLDASAPDNTWYIRVADTYYLWCNDGAQGYDATINNYYKTSGHAFVEQPGTFHNDALNYLPGGNIINDEVSDYAHGQFYIYKRVLDEYAEKENSRVYTNSTASLQPDGTYTIDMETYAISPTHYTLLKKQRPTDFIFVLDTSGSMSTQDCNGYHRHNSFDLEAAAGTTDAAGKTNNSSNSGTTGTYTGNMWVQHTDGVMCPVSVKVQGDGREYKFPSYVYYQRIYLWYTHPVTGQKYWFRSSNDAQEGTWSTTEATYDTATRIGASSQGDRANINVYKGVCYEKRSDSSRLSNMQIAVNQLTYKIQNEAAETGLDHRIAIVQYGSDSSGSWTNMGMYTTDNASRVAYEGAGTVPAENYQKAFHTVSQFGQVRTIIDNLTASGDTFVNYGMDMAYNILANSDSSYLAHGNRSACILMITDGVPGLGSDYPDSALSTANSAIANAYNVKQQGAYVFTVQLGNNSISGFDMNAYMDYLSSEYVDSKSMTAPGERNPNNIDYRMDVAAGSSFNLDSFVSSMFTNVTANSRMALSQLDTGSIIRQTLSDKFYAPIGGANATFHLAEGYYDGLGRLAFKEESLAEATEVLNITEAPADGKIHYKIKTDSGADGTSYYKCIDVTGYDYKTNYISKEHGGKKLIVRITGVLPRMTSLDGSELSHINSPISKTDDTGIYQNSAMLAESKEFKPFPNETFTIPEYTYVLDYGLQMLDTDVNGTLCSVSDELTAQRDANGNIKYNDITENGAVGIASNKLDLLYSLSPDKTEESGYTLIKRDDGTYDWFKINVVPASNVYYEETKMNDGASGKVSWSTTGSQDVANRLLPSVDDPYGWDNAYDNTSPYSNGTALSATLNSSNKNTSTKTFKFTGTGIDIVSACGPTTGVIVVNIKDADGKRVKGYIVDTYYAEGAFGGKDLITQVPVVNWTGDDYGTYTVDVAAMYLSSAGAVKATIKSGLKNKLIDTGLVMNSGKPVDNDAAAEMLKNAGLEDYIAEDMEFVWFDDNSVLNGGTGVEPTKKGTRGADPGTAVLDNYIDGFRVYNPLGTDSSLYPETEKNVSYANVINHLATLEGDATELDGIAYIAGSLANGEKLSFANYQSVGPKNELYLNGNNRVSFKITVVPNEKIMLGLRAVNGAVANANISSVVVNDPTKSASYTIKEINSATEMYYDITDCLHSDVRTNGGEVTITVSNTDADMLAINHIKFSGASNSVTGGMSPRSVSRSGDTETGVVANRFLPMTQEDLDEIQAVLAGESIPAVVKNGVVTPIVEEEEEIPGGDNNEGELPGGDDNEGDVPQNPDNGDTGNGDGSDSTESIFDIFSLLKGLIALIKKILFATVGNEHLF